MRMKIADIILSERVRLHEGDLEPLMESMERIGLINPVTVTEEGRLIAGYRRLEAAKRLGWDYIECTVVSPRSEIEMLQIEADENMTRKDFTYEEVLRYEEMKRFLSARGLKKLLLVLKRLIKRFIEFLKKLFRRE